MIGGFNLLGLIYNSRKYILAVGVFVVLWGLALGVKGYYYDWHVKPVLVLKKKLKKSNEDLNTTRSLFRSCESKAKVKVFVTENNSVFNGLRETIKEVENEESSVVEFNGSDYDWMYQ